MTIETIGGAVCLPNGAAVPLSKAVRTGDFILASGQLAFGADGKIVEGGNRCANPTMSGKHQGLARLGGCRNGRCCPSRDLVDGHRRFRGLQCGLRRVFPAQPTGAVCRVFGFDAARCLG